MTNGPGGRYDPYGTPPGDPDGNPFAGRYGDPYRESYGEQSPEEQPYGGRTYSQQPYEEQPYGDQPYGADPYGGDPYAGEPYPPERGGTSRGLVVAAGVVGVLLVAVLGVVGYLVVRGSDGGSLGFGGSPRVTQTSYVDPTAPAGSSDQGGGQGAQGSTAPSSAQKSKTSTPPTRPPVPSGVVEECGDTGRTTLGRSARGTTITSCPFADAVREAYVSAGHTGQSATVSAYSPVTGTTYSMSCSGDGSPSPVVSCSGGNGALVYIY